MTNHLEFFATLHDPLPKKKKTKLPKRFRKRGKRKERKTNGKSKRPIYKEYMRSSTWANRRARYYKKHKKECFICKSTFQVGLHHITYKNLGNEKDEDLIPLCWFHHEDLHTVCGHKSKEATQYMIEEAEKEAAHQLLGHISRVQGR